MRAQSTGWIPTSFNYYYLMCKSGWCLLFQDALINRRTDSSNPESEVWSQNANQDQVQLC